MIANLTAGNKVKFNYIKERIRTYDSFPAQTHYEVEGYEGKVLEVRDTASNPVSRETVFRDQKVERSRYLLIVQLPDNKIKSFYDGRIVGIEKVNETPDQTAKTTNFDWQVIENSDYSSKVKNFILNMYANILDKMAK